VRTASLVLIEARGDKAIHSTVVQLWCWGTQSCVMSLGTCCVRLGCVEMEWQQYGAGGLVVSLGRVAGMPNSGRESTHAA